MNSLQQQVNEQINKLIDKGYSQNQIASMSRVSPGTISDVRKGKRKLSENLFKAIAQRIQIYTLGEDLAKEVKQYKMIWNIATESQKQSSFTLVTGDTGLGKSSTLKNYAKVNKSVYYIKIDRRYTWNAMLMRIANEMGLLEFQGKGKNRKAKRMWSAKVLDRIQQHVETAEQPPLLIIDEAEELSPSVLKRFKSLRVATEGILAIIICGISSLNTKITKLAGLTPEWGYQKQSNEYSTFARRLKRFAIPNISLQDWKAFFKHFNITDNDIVTYATTKWWNYDDPACVIHQIIKLGIEPTKVSLNEIKQL